MTDRIEQSYSQIVKALSKDDTKYDTLTDLFIGLCQEIKADQGSVEDWIYIGENEEYPLTDLIIGAFWHFTEWHEGQTSSTYQALCALGEIFKPGMTSGVESDTPQEFVYSILNKSAEGRKND